MTTSRDLQKALAPLRCIHDRGYKHETIEGRETAKMARYPSVIVLTTLCRDAIMRPVPGNADCAKDARRPP